MTVVIDTCILSPFLSKNGPTAKLVDWMIELEKPSISVVTQFEIEMGLRSAGLPKVLKLFPKLLQQYEITILEFSAKHSKIAAAQGGAMKKLGRIYSIQDLWIGATAKIADYRLATANVKDFDHWNGLEIINPLF